MDVREQIIEIIESVAPGCGADQIDGNADLRDELELDSMDFLSILVGIKDALGVEVAERDYPLVRTLDALVEHVKGLKAGKG